MADEQQLRQSNSRTVRKSLLVVVAMFGFGFALAPMYEAFCNAFGINGRFLEIEKGSYDADAKAKQFAGLSQVDKSRTVKVQFTASRNQNLNWEFRALENVVDVHPGEVKTVKYFARNLTDRTVVAQAVPSIVPGQAVKYFSKIECFCFTQQTFKPGEEREMPLRFVVDAGLPKKISTLTLSYTFFDTNREQVKVSSQSAQSSIHIAGK